MTTEYRPLLTVELRELLAKATPGPWRVHENPRRKDLEIHASDDAEIATVHDYGKEYEAAKENDAALIVAAVNALPELLAQAAEIEALRAHCEALTGVRFSERCHAALKARAEAAEARAARLGEVLCDLESWMDGWVRASAAVGRIATDAKDAIDAARSAVSGGGGA